MELCIRWNLCRCCLKEEKSSDAVEGSSRVMINIFNEKKLVQQIMDATGIELLADDGLPQKICRKCLAVVKMSSTFRSTCRKSDDYLQSVVRKTKSASSLFKLPGKFHDNSNTEDEDYEIIDTIFDDSSDNDADDTAAQPSKVANNNSANESETQNQQLQQNSKTKRKVSADETSEEARTVYVEDASTQSEAVEVCQSGNKPILQCNRKSSDEPIIEMVDEEIAYESDAATEPIIVNDIEQQNASNFAESYDTIYQYNDEDELIEPKPEPIIVNAAEEENRITANNSNDEENELYYILDNTDIKAETIFEPIDGNIYENTMEIIDEETEEESQDCIVDKMLTKRSAPQTTYKIKCDKRLIPIESSHLKFRKSRSTTQLQKQNKTAGENSIFVCDKCGNSFNNRSLMNYHLRQHQNEKNYECELCGKRFNASCNLSQHMRTHSGEKPHSCQYCGRRFTDRSTHIKHERIHTNERPFTCDICNKAFSLSTTLKAHKKVHSDEKPFACEPCNKAFKLPHQLKAHLKTSLHKVFVAKLASLAKVNDNN